VIELRKRRNLFLIKGATKGLLVKKKGRGRRKKWNGKQVKSPPRSLLRRNIEKSCRAAHDGEEFERPVMIYQEKEIKGSDREKKG